MEQQNDLLDHFYTIDDRSTSAVCVASAFEGAEIDLLGQPVNDFSGRG